ncbi:hypothetical protein D3C79_843200 [compost metagenome]
MRQGILPGYVAAARADDHCQFAFVIQLLRGQRAHNGFTVANQGRGEAGEEGGVVRLLVGTFFGVIRVVQADTDDFARPLDRR